MEKTVVKGYGLSFLVHLILFLLFLRLNIHQKLVIPEFAEMIMPSAMEEAAEGEEPEAAEGGINRTLPENITLPEKMELKDDDRLSQYTHQKAVEETRPSFLERKPVKAPGVPVNQNPVPERVLAEKPTPRQGMFRPTLPPMEGSGTSAGAEVEKVYQIEWEGGINREILYEVLPDVSGLRASGTTIKLVITVEPSGTVLQVEPVQKGGNTELENRAIEALKKWRFAPLPNDGKNQKGIITFHFINR